jgi:pSer/pThr/pTyr-binding forkhead associated (FHA) protein
MLIGRGLGTAALSNEPYINLSWACDPGEAEEFGVSRRHAEIGRRDTGFAIRDMSSTNGTRIKRSGQAGWTTLLPEVWTPLLEGDIVQFGLLECSVSLVR